MNRRYLLTAAALGLCAPAYAQLPPPITPPATGAEKITCTQNGVPKTCTSAQIAGLAAPVGPQATHNVLAGPVSGSPAIPTFRALQVTDLPTGTSGDVVPLLNGANTWSGVQIFNGGIGLPSQAANLVYAAPNGTSGVPTFRGLVTSDIPTGTSGSAIPLLSGSNAWSNPNAFATSNIGFVNTQYSSPYQFFGNGATPGVWYNTEFAGNNVTENLSSGIVVPSTATNLQTNAIGAWITSNRTRPANGGDVALFTRALAGANGSVVFPVNLLGADTAGFTGQEITNEFDYNVSAADTNVSGINLVMVSTTGQVLTGFRDAVIVQGAFHPTSQWTNGFRTFDGAIVNYALLVGATSTANGVNSQPIAFTSRSSGGTEYRATIMADSGGGIDIRPGCASCAIAFQDFNGASNFAYVNGSTFTTIKPFQLAPTTFASLPTCSGNEGMMAYITDASSPIIAWHQQVTAGGGANKAFISCDGSGWFAFNY